MKPRLLDLLPLKLRTRIAIGDECWEWTGWRNDLGYGYVRWEGRDQPAHRIVYEHLGEHGLGRDLELDHLCRNTGCVNPHHLEPVTHRENIRRGRAATKTSCKYGHDWTDPRNVYRRKDGRRYCAACSREQQRKAYATSTA